MKWILQRCQTVIRSGGPPAIAAYCSFTSPAFGSMAAVAPMASARSRRFSANSLTTTWRAPEKRANVVHERPMGPAPITSTSVPGRMAALSITWWPTESGSAVAPSRNPRPCGSLSALPASTRMYSA